VRLYRQALDGAVSPSQALASMRELMPGQACNGFWHGQPGLLQVAA